jgi:hypothetical protein
MRVFVPNKTRGAKLKKSLRDYAPRLNRESVKELRPKLHECEPRPKKQGVEPQRKMRGDSPSNKLNANALNDNWPRPRFKVTMPLQAVLTWKQLNINAMAQSHNR